MSKYNRFSTSNQTYGTAYGQSYSGYNTSIIGNASTGNTYTSNSTYITPAVLGNAGIPGPLQTVPQPENENMSATSQNHPLIIEKNVNHLICYQSGGCLLIDKFLTPHEVTKLSEEIISSCSFETKYMPINGKLIGMPRKITYFGNKDYSYSGVNHAKQPFPVFINSLLAKLAGSVVITSLIKKSNLEKLNSCLINLYEDKDDYIHFHSDDEKELGPDNEKNILIFSLSLGSEREFVVKSKDKSRELKMTLPNGSLFIMYGDFQKKFVHSLLKSKNDCEKRINLTFRVIM